MATWNDWQTLSSPLIYWEKVRNDYIYMILEDGSIYTLDESIADNSAHVDDLTPLTGGYTITVLGGAAFQGEVYLLIKEVSGGTTHWFICKYTPSGGQTNLWTSVSHGMPIDSIFNLNDIAANAQGVIVVGAALIGGTERPWVMGGYNSTWFQLYYDGSVVDTFLECWSNAERFAAARQDGPVTYQLYTSARYNWSYWSNTGSTEYPVVIQGLGKYFFTKEAADADQWLYTEDFSSLYDWMPATSAGTNMLLYPYMGYWFTFAKDASKMAVKYNSSTGAWDTDRSAGTFVDVHMAITGVNKALFNYIASTSPTYKIWKRTPDGAGMQSGGEASQKISIDRDSNHVYVSTIGLDTITPYYWKVSQDLSTVNLIETSTVSGVHAGVHSSASGCIYCFGNIDGDMFRYSTDKYITFSGYSVPSGTIPTDTTTLFSNRGAGDPTGIVATITLSGESNKAYNFNMQELSILVMEAESQSRASGHTFIGAYIPISGNVIRYSDDDGLFWEERSTGMPTTTITDIDFAFGDD